MTMLSSLVFLLAVSPLAVQAALDVDFSSRDSIKRAAKLVAEDMLTFYHGEEPGNTLGTLPGPPQAGEYYWWESGAMWGTLLDYWRWTGDDSFNDMAYRALLWQAGPDKDFRTINFTASLGNDDQAFWAMSALIAAETKLKDPPPDQAQWLSTAQAVWHEQTADFLRDGGCGFGLRWQAVKENRGFDYKNTIANGCFFNMGARLGRYTDNTTYLDWSERTWDWLVELKYISPEYHVYDGAYITDNCTTITKAQFSYNAGILLQGAAFMYNYTSDEKWLERVNGLLDGMERDFFPKGVAYEPPCEAGWCGTDQLTFKGFVHRWMAYTMNLVPETKDKILPLLKSSAKAAVKQCTGPPNGRMCGFHWQKGVFDGKIGAGQQMSVLGALISLLAEDAPAPLTNKTGGTSKSDPNAGIPGSIDLSLPDITTGDKAGAGILTVAAIAIAVGSLWWMLV
ncbi:glycoside hydrolase family 76 protein [Poronia punctata]|nr:glycoside hydrolase family 76 protein [Poronia punctata]